MDFSEIMASLRQYYDQDSERRDQVSKPPWKIKERQYFLEYLRNENKTLFLEIGAGTGQDSKFFQDQGLNVICTDLSSEMVNRCQQKGLEAYQMDFLNLDFPLAFFDAIYAVNCLLHVPRSELAGVLGILHQLLKPNGLFYLGLWGGEDKEGVYGETPESSRYYSFHSNQQIKKAVSRVFKIEYFNVLELGEEDDVNYFQSMVLRKTKLSDKTIA